MPRHRRSRRRRCRRDPRATLNQEAPTPLPQACAPGQPAGYQIFQYLYMGQPVFWVPVPTPWAPVSGPSPCDALGGSALAPGTAATQEVQGAASTAACLPACPPACPRPLQSPPSPPGSDYVFISDSDEDARTETHNEQAPCTSTNQDETNRQRILEELEVVPEAMKASKEVAKQLNKDAERILNVLKTPECREHLRSIACGKRKSARHDEFQQSGMLLSGLGPFSLFENMKSELLHTLDKHCETCESMFDPTYQWSVLLPEAIIYGAQQILKCSEKDATAYYENTSKFIVPQE